MSRSKKTRKGGENSPKLQPRTKKQDRTSVTTKRKESGNKSGSRHNESLIQQQAPQSDLAKKKDPRHGSKKAVVLELPVSKVEAAKPKAKQPKLSDEQRLLQLEDDPRLNSLLDMLEEGRDLKDSDQKWLDQQLNKIEALMHKLGITDGDEPQAKPKSLSDDDLLEKFESGADLLKAYQDKD
ncbi:Der GTPase-activating protein YihI [Shewanella salipaludis]|uniref:Der GTPase-activating protein YihI n=1 Tax=Shewanella salipaludis TaxID=2723052 RepID=A0A972FWU0_9GAMM|nr:Der GTPase-activating protein YihI [Shewanella salipaludis]NMH66709.1 Der GTPase-activating protein YihI [Shewanella salipaludis]